MKFKKCINILVLCIIMLSLTSCIFGLFLVGGTGEYEYETINNEIVKIYGQGLYKNDSVSVAAQGKASDLVTLVLGIPMLLVSVYFANKGSFRGRLILTGTLGYFLYTFISYTFLWMYNPFFIIYVMLMSLSLYAFILVMMSFDMENIAMNFKEELPVRFLGGFQIVIAIAIGMLWLGKIAPSIFKESVPIGLEHYTTLVIQGMDLGFVVPTLILSGILLIKRKPFGYLMSAILIIKGITMFIDISVMMINMSLHNVSMNLVEIIMFPLLTLLTTIPLIILLRNTKRNSEAFLKE